MQATAILPGMGAQAGNKGLPSGQPEGDAEFEDAFNESATEVDAVDELPAEVNAETEAEAVELLSGETDTTDPESVLGPLDPEVEATAALQAVPAENIAPPVRKIEKQIPEEVVEKPQQNVLPRTAEAITDLKPSHNEAAPIAKGAVPKTDLLPNRPVDGAPISRQSDVSASVIDVEIEALAPQTTPSPREVPLARAVEVGKLQTPNTLFDFKPEAGTERGRFELVWPEKAPPKGPASSEMVVQIRAASSATKVEPESTKLTLQAETVSRVIDPSLSEDLFSLPEPGRSRTDGAPQTQMVVVMANGRADLPLNIARQMAEALQRAPDRTIEVALSPAELGSVRMKLMPTDVSMMVSILAERPETIDLLRRNIEILQDAIAAIGYKDVAFSFDATGKQASDGGFDLNQNSSGATNQQSTEALETVGEVEVVATQIVTGRMDMRV